MKTISKVLYIIFTVILLMGVGSTGYFTLGFIRSEFERMDSDVAAVTVIASLVILLASLIIAGSISSASRGSKQNQLRWDKAATYKVVINVWQEQLFGPGLENPVTNMASEELQVLDRLLFLYGSPEVIKAHARLRALERDGGAQDPNVSLQFARTLMDMRKDLGSETLGFPAEELQQLILSSSDDAIVSTRKDGYQAFQSQVSLTTTIDGQRRRRV